MSDLQPFMKLVSVFQLLLCRPLTGLIACWTEPENTDTCSSGVCRNDTNQTESFVDLLELNDPQSSSERRIRSEVAPSFHPRICSVQHFVPLGALKGATIV